MEDLVVERVTDRLPSALVQVEDLVSEEPREIGAAAAGAGMTTGGAAGAGAGR
ncbi:hypothetical protein [Lutibaculum baratangense]|uniref:Uncharacterized protein n=1 Tax=Lutibaculum baratangense AMV1 TaxID=631454 RepID=V4RFB6_9HYPH|nr:hypothetical protein [Lutibaculum baratangense]ESR24064.1 hypothetical protein N177_2513 [Lutibaculum baratangense AMV1]